MQKIFFFIFLFISVVSFSQKKHSDFAGDLNGDGYKDIVVADKTNFKDYSGRVKVYFGSSTGVSITAGWTYTCDKGNYLDSKYSVSIIDDINGDGIDELSITVTSWPGKTMPWHRHILIFYGKKQNFGEQFSVVKMEEDEKSSFGLREFAAFDYTGDGHADILAISSKVVYKLNDRKETDRKLFLYRGSDTGLANKPEFIKDVNENYGFIYAGDVNNDGIDDIQMVEQDGRQMVWTQFLGSRNGTAEHKDFLAYDKPRELSNDLVFNNKARDCNGDKYDDDYIFRIDRSRLIRLKKPDSAIYTLDFYPGGPSGLSNTIMYSWEMKAAPDTRLNSTTCDDLNNDGYADFILKRYTPSMQAFILWGGKNGMRFDSSDAFNQLFHSINEVRYGVDSVEPLGDINNDGCADLLLSDVYLVYGSKDGKFSQPVKLNF